MEHPNRCIQLLWYCLCKNKCAEFEIGKSEIEKLTETDVSKVCIQMLNNKEIFKSFRFNSVGGDVVEFVAFKPISIGSRVTAIETILIEQTKEIYMKIVFEIIILFLLLF